MPAFDRFASRKISLFTVVIIVLTIVLTWYWQKPSADAQFKIGSEAFSTANTWHHLANITKTPHYTGSPGHKNVRDYLLEELRKLGLNVQIQDTLALNSKYFVASNVSNIIAKIPATYKSEHSKAVLLISHYDSANGYSLGASDAGSGVSVILEAVRAFLDSNIDHSNDVYILFTDAEEQGLLGAQGFIDEHPLADDIGLALNFEARGSGGASYTLLETNQGNQQLIKGLVAANVANPTANSLMYSIYKMLPNDTDLTVFREGGDIPGFNFAFIDDHFDYHTQQDTLERLDPASLNHQISYISALLPYFANADLATLDSSKDVVYFNFANLALYDYPFSWVLPMSALVALVFLMLSINGVKKRRINLKYALIATLPMIINLAISLLVGIGGWKFLTWLYPQFSEVPQGFTYSGHYIIACAILLTLGFTIWVYQLLVKKFSRIKKIEWFLPIIVFWILMNLLLAIYLTGAGFFIILAVAPLAIFGNLLRYKASVNRQAITYTLFSLPGLIIITPLIPVLVIGLGLSSLAIATAITTLVFMTLIPIMFVIRGTKAIRLLCFAGALISFVGISFNADYSIERKKSSSVNYLYDTESKQAMLFSYNSHLDEFTRNFFDEKDRDTRNLKDLFSFRANRPPQYATVTPNLDIALSNVSTTRLENENGRVKLTMTIEPNRQLNSIQIITDEPINLFALAINNKSFEISESRIRNKTVMSYVVTDQQPITLDIMYQSEQPAKLRLIEISRDLPQLWPQFPSRPDYIMPSPFRLTDGIIISQPIASN